MSEGPGGFTIYAKLDTSQLKAQIKEFQEMFTKAQKQVQRVIPPQATAQAKQMRRVSGGARQQAQQINKQVGIFEKMREGIGGIAKSSLALIGIGAGIAGIFALMMEASPILQGTFRLLQTSVLLFLRPIGDFIGMLLRPIMIEFLRKVILPYYQHVAPFMRQLGETAGKAIAAFFTDPRKGLDGLLVSIINWPAWMRDPTGTGTAPIPGVPGGGGGLDDLKERAREMSEDAADAAESTSQMSHWIDFSARKSGDINDSVSRMRDQFENSSSSAADIARVNRVIQEHYLQSGLSSQVLPEEMAKINDSARQGSESMGKSTEEMAKINESAQQSSVNIGNAAGHFNLIDLDAALMKEDTTKAKDNVFGANQAMVAAAVGMAGYAAIAKASLEGVAAELLGLGSRFTGILGPILTNPTIISELTGFGGPQEAFAEEEKKKKKGGRRVVRVGSPTGAGSGFTPGLGSRGGAAAHIPNARGGIINEFVLGVGKSGKTYSFGEEAPAVPEMVTPIRGGAGAFRMPSRPAELHIHIGNINHPMDLLKLKRMVKQWMQEGNSRSGII